MTDSIAIPSSSSSASYGRQVETQKTDATNAGPTPVAAPLPGHSNSPYGRSISTESSPASPFPSLKAINSSWVHSASESSEGAVSTDSEQGRKLSAREKGKMPARYRADQWEKHVPASPSADYARRASFLSSSLSKSEHTVVNVGEPDRPRLITCVKASQGFDWNQEIFLPSYISDRNHMTDLERRQDPVEDIFITDEEAEMMFPR